MNDINELRRHLFETLRGLKDKDDPMDIDRAKAVSDVAKTIIDSARVEVDAMRLVGSDQGTGFIPLGKDDEEPRRIVDKQRGTTTTVELLEGARRTVHTAK